MKRKKRGRPPKQKPVAEPEVSEESELSESPVMPETQGPSGIVLCECGQPAQFSSHQCWGCSHRP